MKNRTIKVLILMSSFLLGCSDDEMVDYQTYIETYVVSDKQIKTECYTRGGCREYYQIWFQTKRITEKCYVDSNTYNATKRGDTIKLLVKTITKKVK